MKKFISALCATAMALTTAGIVSSPVAAAPIRMTDQVSGIVAPVDRLLVDHRGYSKYKDHTRRFRADRRDRRADRSYRRADRAYRYRRGQHRRGYDDLGAFVAGAIIGNVLNQAISRPRVRVYTGGNAHARWCYDRYRSYRAWDNTFQPYHGSRRICDSPYG